MYSPDHIKGSIPYNWYPTVVGDSETVTSDMVGGRLRVFGSDPKSPVTQPVVLAPSPRGHTFDW